MHAKMQVFLHQPWQQMHASLILLFGKTKALFRKDTAREKTAYLHKLFCAKRKRHQRTKIGDCFSMKSKATSKN